MSSLFSEIQQRRITNLKKLGLLAEHISPGSATRVVRKGKSSVSLYTVGYEKRDGDQLISVLVDNGIKTLADVRQRAMSRKPDFRAAALRKKCQEAGIEYQSWPSLGSTVELRDELAESGNFTQFASDFRELALQTLMTDIKRLAQSVSLSPTALLCYERAHEECHRSIIADLAAKHIDATVIAVC